MRALWRQRPYLVSAFLLACAVTLFFAVRFVTQAIYWSDPAHQNQTVEGWMTVGYIAKSWQVDPHQLDDLAGLPQPLQFQELRAAAAPAASAWPTSVTRPAARSSALPAATGLQAVLSGSCSQATNQQVAHFIASGQPAFAIDPLRIAAGEDVQGQACAWAAPLLEAGAGPVLIYSTAAATSVAATQNQLGAMQAGALVEHCMAALSQQLVALGVRQLVLAGGETSGACVQALGIAQMQIGPQIDPGVPWCHARASAAGGAGLHLTLKSGNFGTPDFFTKAFKVLS